METSKLDHLFKAFKRNYTLVPLEVFGKNPYKTLVSTILSARTKDEVTLVASKRLLQSIFMRFQGRTLTQTELMKLPGVGRKTANLVLNRAFGIPAIAVDTHVHRICNVLGWVG